MKRNPTSEMIQKWLEEIKRTVNPEELGMILIRNGIVRGAAKSGRPARGMKLSYDEQTLNALISLYEARAGIVDVRRGSTAGRLDGGLPKP